MKNELIAYIEERQRELRNERYYPMSYHGGDVADILDEIIERINFLDSNLTASPDKVQ